MTQKDNKEICELCGKTKEEHPEGFCDGRWLNEDGSFNEDFRKFTPKKEITHTQQDKTLVGDTNSKLADATIKRLPKDKTVAKAESPIKIEGSAENNQDEWTIIKENGKVVFEGKIKELEKNIFYRTGKELARQAERQNMLEIIEGLYKSNLKEEDYEAGSFEKNKRVFTKRRVDKFLEELKQKLTEGKDAHTDERGFRK